MMISHPAPAWEHAVSTINKYMSTMYRQTLCQLSTNLVSNSSQRLYTKDYIIRYATTFCHLISKLSLALQITGSCHINFLPPPLSSTSLNLVSKQLPLGFLCTQYDRAECVDTNPCPNLSPNLLPVPPSAHLSLPLQSTPPYVSSSCLSVTNHP